MGELAWEFSLRKNVRFHDGEAFNADTVLFNLDRFFRKNLDRWGIKDVPAGTSFEKTYPWVTRWEKVDDHTVRVHTSEPAPTLWDYIGREPLVPKAYTIKHGVDGAQRAAGGHRALAHGRVEAQGLDALRALRGLLGAAPQFKRLRFQTIPEAAARIAALRAGQVALIEAVPPLDAGVLARDPKLTVVVEPPEARVPPLRQRRAEGQVRVGRQGRPLRATRRSAWP